MKVGYSYLSEQFANVDHIWEQMQKVVQSGDFTLGKRLFEFEEAFADKIGSTHAIGVNSGTDALFLSLKAQGIKGEVITSPFSFYATPASIANAGATPVFADCSLDFNIDPSSIEAYITPRTEAIIPVHWAGRPCNMGVINSIANRRGLFVIEDAAQAFGAVWDQRNCGDWGHSAAFSLHPLKTLNVWGDGGVITTSDRQLAHKLRKLRNHGLENRDTCEFWGYNSRLDSVQAVVALSVLPHVAGAIRKRRENAAWLDNALCDVTGIHCAPEAEKAFNTYYLYTFRAAQRDKLASWLKRHEIDVKIHYPVPLHLQPAAASLGYKRGDLPVAERLADETITIPAHEYVTQEQLQFMSDCIFALQGADVAA